MDFICLSLHLFVAIASFYRSLGLSKFRTSHGLYFGHVDPSNITTQSSSFIMLGRATLTFVVVSILALLCAQVTEATKGPKVTHKVYFDMKQGDKELGRSEYRLYCTLVQQVEGNHDFSCYRPLWWSELQFIYENFRIDYRTL